MRREHSLAEVVDSRGQEAWRFANVWVVGVFQELVYWRGMIGAVAVDTEAWGSHLEMIVEWRATWKAVEDTPMVVDNH